MIGDFLAVFNFNRLFLKLNWFICKGHFTHEPRDVHCIGEDPCLSSKDHIMGVGNTMKKTMFFLMLDKTAIDVHFNMDFVFLDVT